MPVNSWGKRGCFQRVSKERSKGKCISSCDNVENSSHTFVTPFSLFRCRNNSKMDRIGADLNEQNTVGSIVLFGLSCFIKRFRQCPDRNNVPEYGNIII